MSWHFSQLPGECAVLGDNSGMEWYHTVYQVFLNKSDNSCDHCQMLVREEKFRSGG